MKTYQIKNVLLTSKIFGENKKIIRQRNRYQVYILHTRFNWNLSNLYDVRQKKMEEAAIKCEELQKKLLNKVYKSSTEIQDCFFRLMIATYKKKIFNYFNRADNLYEFKSYEILKEYERIFDEHEELKEMIAKKHDHTHYIFAWGLYNYEFINEEQMIEKWRNLIVS